MFTRITLLKRRPGMTVEAFRDYYETHHRLIGERVLAGFAQRYLRRYVAPAGQGLELPDFDVMTEISFPDRATHDRCIAALSEPSVAEWVMADEDRLFDRAAMRVFTVEEAESALEPLSIA
ncbi:hypothetical protein GCM10010909_32720 [Acidocella aquatica]|uniref:EthD domain-containing protein n=1 Tax=Acidocella aquatica TaxID=1922313 RepID=A0ABQ6A9J8_9PROT|nr:EthD domain-containing protein [Acidocella aquatica]GLR68591.1 hypothetical protein GCM10010909_32720 [Acidocella aquatica]